MQKTNIPSHSNVTKTNIPSHSNVTMIHHYFALKLLRLWRTQPQWEDRPWRLQPQWEYVGSVQEP